MAFFITRAFINVSDKFTKFFCVSLCFLAHVCHRVSVVGCSLLLRVHSLNLLTFVFPKYLLKS